MGSITIKTNLAALNAQRRLAQSTASLSDSFTRLSSGLRINRAGDDAAGLAIAESLKVDQRVFNQGVRNLNDGVSLLSIADSALNELSNITVRLTELAEQAANGSLSHVQRKALDEEGQALKAEYFRITQTTEFNGVALFDSEFGELRLQAGFGENGGIISGLGGAISDGTFADRVLYDTGVDTESVTVVDINADGINDLVNVHRSDGSAGVFLGNGDGTFKTYVSYSVGSGSREVRVGDVNNDGIFDLVSADNADDAISVLLGNGDGSFRARSVYAAGDGLETSALADLNSDGFLDVVTADANTSTASVLLGNGDGSFSAPVSYAGAGNTRDVTTGDFNSDGIIDFVTADPFVDAIGVYIGRGDGTFEARVSVASGVQPWHVMSADINNDGHLDIATADNVGESMSVHLGRGDGTFSPVQSYAIGGQSFGGAVGDVNGDGAIDLLGANRDDRTIDVLLGNGDGTFKAFTSYDTVGSAFNVTTGDVDHDGVLDIVSSNIFHGYIAVLTANTVEGVSPLHDFSLATQADARQALPNFKQKLDQLAAQRGQIGAFEARLSTAVATSRVASENYASAGSQILDADVAVEAAQLVRNQILQQAGAAILAQANQGPALALQLLG